MDYQTTKEKIHSHILRLRRKQQLDGRYVLKEYQTIMTESGGGNTGKLAYLCHIENMDTGIVKPLLVKHKEII